MDAPAICNGCGNESPAWDQLCVECDKQVICQNCGNKYKRGQGLQEVDMCASCLQEVFANQEEEKEEIYRSNKPTKPIVDPYEEYGFDYQWELF